MRLTQTGWLIFAVAIACIVVGAFLLTRSGPDANWGIGLFCVGGALGGWAMKSYRQKP
jgi:hypothetical protein